MEANTIIVVGVILALLAMLSFLLMKVSSKEYPKEEIIRPKFEPRNMTFSHCIDEAEKPKRRYKKKRKKNQLLQIMHKLKKDLLEDLRNLTNGLGIGGLGVSQ